MAALKYLIAFVCLTACTAGTAQPPGLTNDTINRQLVFGNKTISLTLDYKNKANISRLTVNGLTVIDGDSGIYSELRTKTAAYSTLHLRPGTAPIATITGPAATTTGPAATTTATTGTIAAPGAPITAPAPAGSSITLTGIIYGDQQLTITESWTFTLLADKIRWDIDRTLSNPLMAEQASLPVFLFNKIDTWEGAYQSYGGLAWFYLFNKKGDSYGVHSSSSKFWNSKTGNGLDVSVDAPGKAIAMSYTRTADDRLAYRIQLADKDLVPRFDSGTHRRLYLRDSTDDVWASFSAAAGKTSQRITLTPFDFNEKYGRGTMTGINGEQVSAVLNTVARIGVIDKQHFGGNSWHTPYGPICLHEQYIAQMGLAINDPAWLKGYQDCLDFYRDNAIKPDGRVWPRWAYTNEDMMPGEVTDKGFYEAQWGFLLDANPDLVTNVAELYDQTGDLAWVKTHQRSCEAALDWICKRDANNNGLVEMMTDSHLQKKGSDWIDIIWSSYENAFVNAKLYHALVLWIAIEKRLGDRVKAAGYAAFAKKLKTSFNKPVAEGGFWDEKNTCYIHWRDKDGSIHGDNMVIPVNFMAIGYDICDRQERKKAILDKIEARMQKEKLFFWPICLYTYGPGEGNDWQFPFPKYENGDLFLSWGALGVKVYAGYRPEIALQYVKNVLAQYAKDGLAFQRYGREKQDGLGDDILAGNSLSVVGLYQAIYGINPRYDRFYLDPHLTPELFGTQLNYNFRQQRLSIGLNDNNYSVSDQRFRIVDKKDFGFYSTGNELRYFRGASEKPSLILTATPLTDITLNMETWSGKWISWTQSSHTPNATPLTYRIGGLRPNSFYALDINNQLKKSIKTNAAGSLQFKYTSVPDSHIVLMAD